MIKDILMHPFLVSVLVLAIAFVLKVLVDKLARNRAEKKEKDIRYITHNIKHFINFVMVLSLLFVWSTEIQNFALSIAAFAVAIVLATREFIQCVIGFFYLVTTRPFRVGDWIQVGDYFGEVAETDWVKTTMHEIDMHTYQFSRKTIYIPNNKLITSSIKNLNYVKRFVTHHFTIVRRESFNPYVIHDELVNQAKLYCEEFHDVATRYNSMIERKLDAKISGPAPVIHFGTTELGEFKASFTLFCPTNKALEIEHKLTECFMALWYEQAKKNKEEQSEA
ncbi:MULTISPECIES: mechanosensitive ion channel family protein [Pseudoalteromonas]|jgi:small-conductance mechanosensitive channel|uniref:Small-conductance mechanosensitive channel n=3 Tax=Pseudoalteromonas TaxID=53246 RepID=A0AAD0TVQ8_9GAMM|nr:MULTISPECIES: mechanosensitive ion channel family protein [Pseudoalteromonas]MDY6887894.1 mechanosensitive ion channel family protein [Pseudomonadota bacterium]AYM85534.1 mechanosensitive ion channel family protein [Pseudoalteromonas agarivorans]AZN31542.1 mechanosensitive ion channel family protein [Pseudoalteromonas sp. Xi13]KPW01850.1 mechanosensitive channel MscS [Pseudoalteromonas sp. P1-11]KYL33237.1 mechanosensitive ion channel protein MscS [Pseudoalteromonas telluritireducens]|tara:strand:+ start:173 stop:1009 length:837 start_codon:yes stop_codon:yes gene_type:complete